MYNGITTSGGAVFHTFISSSSNLLRLTLGVAYTGRNDVPVLPMAGLKWTPNDLWDVSLILPNPRVSRQILESDDSETRAYIGGGLGGGTWNVLTDEGLQDELSLREFRAALGLKQNSKRLGRIFGEVGVGFGREIEFENSSDEFTYDNGLTLQLGWQY